MGRVERSVRQVHAGRKNRDSLNIAENSLKNILFECRKNNCLERGRQMFKKDDFDFIL